MSWIILSGLLVLALVFTATPLLERTDEPASPQNPEIEDIRNQLINLQHQIEAKTISAESGNELRRTLEMRALEILDTPFAPKAQSSNFSYALAPIALVAGAFVLYAQLGSPDYSPTAATQISPTPTNLQNLAPEELVSLLEQKLATDPSPPPLGYQLLGRALMAAERYEDALSAYETAVELSGEAPDVQLEYRNAQAYISSLQRPGPTLTEETLNSFENLAPAEQEQMIAGMVDGLALKLSEDPSDFEGWRRLLQARQVLRQEELAQAELKAGIETLAGAPAQQAQLRELGAEFGIVLTR